MVKVLFNNLVKILIILNCLMVIGHGSVQANSKELIVAEYKKDYSGSSNYVYLVKYIFRNGSLTTREVLFESPTYKKVNGKEVYSVNFREAYIYKNQYVVSSTGSVFDLQGRSLLNGQSVELVAEDGSKLVFYQSSRDMGQGYWILDLKTKKFEQVTDESYRTVEGIQSPDYQHGLNFKRLNPGFKIELSDTKNRRVDIVSDAGEGTKLDLRANTRPKVPVFWVDNYNFLYAQYSSIVRVRLVNIKDKSNTILGRFFFVPAAFGNAYFGRDVENNILFKNSKGTYEVDVNNKSIKLRKFRLAGHYFHIDKELQKMGHDIRYKGYKIGRLWVGSSKTTEGHFAAEYGEPGSNLGYPKGAVVWSDISKDWTTININWVCSIIGWVDK